MINISRHYGGHAFAVPRQARADNHAWPGDLVNVYSLVMNSLETFFDQTLEILTYFDRLISVSVFIFNFQFYSISLFFIHYKTCLYVKIIPIYSEGYPVSWCLSNRQDQTLLIYYFEHLKKKTVTISLKYFISDDRFYNVGYQYSIDIHKSYVCGMQIVSGEVP